MKPTDWRLKGQEPMSPGQRGLLNAACGDLALHLDWHGIRLSKDHWRHLISGTVLGFITVPMVDMGDGRQGIVMLGGSSTELSRTQATEAITMAFWIGDNPQDQHLDAKPIVWSDLVYVARRIPDHER